MPTNEGHLFCPGIFKMPLSRTNKLMKTPLLDSLLNAMNSVDKEKRELELLKKLVNRKGECPHRIKFKDFCSQCYEEASQH